MRGNVSVREAVGSSLALLAPRERGVYRVALLGQVALSLLDLVGVLLVAAVGYVTATLATGSPLPAPVGSLVAKVGIGEVTVAGAATILGAAAALVLVTKSVGSLLIQRAVFRFLGHRASEVADQMATAFLRQPLTRLQMRPSHWNAFAFVEGLTHAVPQILGGFLVVCGEVALLVVLGMGLVVLDPMTAIVALAYFGSFLWVIHRRLSRKAAELSRATAAASIETRSAVQDSVSTYREMSVAGRRDHFRERIVAGRTALSRSQADTYFLAAIPRHGIEAALVVGSALVVLVLALTQDQASAFASLFLFLAAASRMTPALLRLNGAVTTVKSSAAGAERTFILIDELRIGANQPNPPASLAVSGPVFDARPERFDIAADSLSVRYPGSSVPALTHVNLRVPQGTSLALVGPTGAGKSSLVDVLLGVALPTSGAVRIGGQAPVDFVAAFPGALAYVPQDVAIIHGTIRENVALGLSKTVVTDDRVWEALDQAHLGSLVRSLSDGLDTEVGDRGVRLSGGQRQRIGLARAFYQLPSILVLDEATSALDSETERTVADTIAALGAGVTVITVAHRLATIRNADRVAYLDAGRLVASGTFAEVRASVPSFETQARLMGL